MGHLVFAATSNWKQLDVKHGNAKITNASDLLRLILVRAAADLPLRQTVALMAQAGARLHLRMRLSDLKYLQVRSTEIDEGEIEPNELVVAGPRVLPRSRRSTRVRRRDLLVRLNRPMPLR